MMARVLRDLALIIPNRPLTPEEIGAAARELLDASVADDLKAGFLRVCEDFLDHDQPMLLEPLSLALKESDVMAGEQR